MSTIHLCYDCKTELKENEDTQEIEGGKCLKYKDGDKDIYIIKCNKCYEKDPSLRNFRKTEVFSRVVGYMRPVDQWHKGKQEEYKERKVFKK